MNDEIAFRGIQLNSWVALADMIQQLLTVELDCMHLQALLK